MKEKKRNFFKLGLGPFYVLALAQQTATATATRVGIFAYGSGRAFSFHVRAGPAGQKSTGQNFSYDLQAKSRGETEFLKKVETIFLKKVFNS